LAAGSSENYSAGRTGVVKLEMKGAKQIRYGRSCNRCKTYFVTNDPGCYICPWCAKVGGAELLKEIPDVQSREIDRVKG